MSVPGTLLTERLPSNQHEGIPTTPPAMPTSQDASSAVQEHQEKGDVLDTNQGPSSGNPGSTPCPVVVDNDEVRAERLLRRPSALRISRTLVRSVVLFGIGILMIAALGGWLLYLQISAQGAPSHRDSFRVTDPNESLLVQLPELQDDTSTPILILQENITEGPDLMGSWYPVPNVPYKNP